MKHLIVQERQSMPQNRRRGRGMSLNEILDKIGEITKNEGTILMHESLNCFSELYLEGWI